MNYEYIDISGPEADDRVRFIYFQASDYSIHQQFINYNLPIYRYSDPRVSMPFYFVSRWLFEIWDNFHQQRVRVTLLNPQQPRPLRPDFVRCLADSARLTSYIYHDTKLRAKYSVLLTLDPEYLCNIAQYKELLEDLRTAGYEVQVKENYDL